MYLRQWIYAGPFDIDVSDRYESNYFVDPRQYSDLFEELLHIFHNAKLKEGLAVTCFNQTSICSLKRMDPTESKVTWARFGYHARMLATFAAAELHLDHPCILDFDFWVCGGCVVSVNGKIQYRHDGLGRTECSTKIGLQLDQGKNDLNILLFNVHLHCTNSFAMRCTGRPPSVRLPLALTDLQHDQLESDFKVLFLERYIFEPGNPVCVCISRSLLTTSGQFHFEIMKTGKGAGRHIKPIAAKSITLCQQPLSLHHEIVGADHFIEPGEYRVDCWYITETGLRIKGPELPFCVVEWLDALPEREYIERKTFLLDQFSRMPDDNIADIPYFDVYRELAKLETAHPEDICIHVLERTLDYIDARYDCADFCLHGILRIYIKFGKSDWLDPSLIQRMKQTILQFKYWETDPGPSMMFTRSENHEFLFYSAEYIAGLLFPTDDFVCSRQKGLFHLERGRQKVGRWIKEKGSCGFREWHSNTYYEENMLGLLNVHDFGESFGPLRTQARQLLDLIGIILASHSFEGIMGTTHGRAYEDSVLYPSMERMGYLNWLLFAKPHALLRKISIGACTLAGSEYNPPPYIEHIAHDTEPLETYSQMGFFPERDQWGVRCATFRTTDFMVSGMVESKQGEFGHQVHTGQVTLSGGIPIFVTCFDNKSDTTRPSYWGGQYQIPKTIAHRNVLMHVCNIEGEIGATHCYFPKDRLDETIRHGRWIFGRKQDAYIAVYSLQAYEEVKHGIYANQELLCPHKYNVWILEAGNFSIFGSFREFVSRVRDAKVDADDQGISYQSPSSGRITTGWNRPTLIQGESFSAQSFPLIENRYVSGQYGVGWTQIDISGKQKILDFRF